MDGRPRDMWSCKLALDIPEGIVMKNIFVEIIIVNFANQKS